MTTSVSGSAIARQVDYYVADTRRSWTSVIITSLAQPLCYLLALGLGLGSYVDDGRSRVELGGLSYLQFVAPALVAVGTLVQTFLDSTMPVIVRLNRSKVYHSMVTTPLTPRDIVRAHLALAAIRAVVSSIVILGVVAIFGGVRSPWGILAVPTTALMAASLAAPLLSFTASLRTENGLSVAYRFGLVPTMLFSGAFFPLANLPTALRFIADVLPVSHGIALARSLSSGDVDWWRSAGDVAYLFAWVIGGTLLAVRSFERRLTR
jgi:lipooligosaccharide transport system permease protein